MKKVNTLVVFLCILCTSCCMELMAQRSQGTVTGRVISPEGQALEHVVVRFVRTNHGGYSDQDGNFEFRAPAGIYTLELSFLGGQPKTQRVTVESRQTTNLGDITYQIGDKSLDEVLIVGSNRMANKNTTYVARMPLSYIENPQAYTVIPKELLEAQIVTSMDEALRNVTGGASIARGFGSGGVGVQIVQRGFSSNVNMRNGMSTNGLALSDPINVERIEAIKGPSGTLYGTDVSYGGLINKVTKKPHAEKAVSLSYTAGSWSNNRITADVNTPINEDKTLLFRINTLLSSTNSYMLGTPTNKSWALTPSISYKASDKLSFLLDVEVYHNEGLANFIQIATNTESRLYDEGLRSVNELNYDWKNSYADRELTSTTESYNANFDMEYAFNDNWKSNTIFSHSGTNLLSNYFFLNYQTASTFTRGLNRIPSYFGREQFQQNFSGKFKIGEMNNKLLFGFDYLRSTMEDKRRNITYDTAPVSYDNASLVSMEVVDSLFANNALNGGEVRARTGTYTNIYSLYISEVLEITDQLSILAAIRGERYVGTSYSQTAFSPKFGIVYEIIDDQLSIFGNALNGYRNTGSGASDEEGTITDWKPEKAIQIEGGIKTQLGGDRLVATLGIYNIKVSNIVRSVPFDNTASGGVSGSYSVQDGERVSKGFDIDLTAFPLPGLTIIAGYGYNDSKYQKTSVNASGIAELDGKRPSRLPLHSANFWVDYKLTTGQIKGLGVAIGGNYVTETFYSDYNYLSSPNRLSLDGSVYYSVPRFRVALKINNLANEKGWTIGRGMQPIKPREVLGSVTFTM